jgi:hypothetical protein
MLKSSKAPAPRAMSLSTVEAVTPDDLEGSDTTVEWLMDGVMPAKGLAVLAGFQGLQVVQESWSVRSAASFLHYLLAQVDPVLRANDGNRLIRVHGRHVRYLEGGPRAWLMVTLVDLTPLTIQPIEIHERSDSHGEAF